MDENGRTLLAGHSSDSPHTAVVTVAVNPVTHAMLIDGESLYGDLDGRYQQLTDSIPDSDDSASGIKATMTAGTSLVFGDVCYVGSDGKMEKADADAIATSSAIAMALATIAEDASGSFLFSGFVRDDTWNWGTVGGLIYLSLTAGALTQTRPSATDDVIQIMGVATHADRIYFNPNLVQVEHV